MMLAADIDELPMHEQTEQPARIAAISITLHIARPAPASTPTPGKSPVANSCSSGWKIT